MRFWALNRKKVLCRLGIKMNLLNKIQQELKVSKNQFNSFGKYNYRSCEDILEAVKPLLGTGTLTLTDEVVNVGNFNYVKARAVLSDDKNLYVVYVEAYAREEEDKKGMDASQMTGTASSYARKYALNGLFCIDDTKDADTMDNTSKSKVEAHKDTSGQVCEKHNTEMKFSEKKNKFYCEQCVKEYYAGKDK